MTFCGEGFPCVLLLSRFINFSEILIYHLLKTVGSPRLDYL